MPLYEYNCARCGKRFSILVGMTAVPEPETCPHCGNVEAKRRVTRFTRGRSDGDRASALAGLGDVDDAADPTTMRKWTDELKNEIGEDLGDDFDEYLDSAEAGDDDSDIDE